MNKLERMKRKMRGLLAQAVGLKKKNVRDVKLLEQMSDLAADIAIETIRQNPVTPIRLRKAVRNVMDYNWEKEEDDWRANFAANSEVADRNHIFRDLVILETWLKRGW